MNRRKTSPQVRRKRLMGQRPPRVRRKLAVGIIERTQAELISARAEEPGGKPPHRRKDGTISARAEEVTASKLHSRSAKVDLRASGGTLVMAALSAGAAGRSPRVRRNRTRSGFSPPNDGSISACGGTRSTSAAMSLMRSRSPRARRNREKPPALAGGQGAISARAEEPRRP